MGRLATEGLADGESMKLLMTSNKRSPVNSDGMLADGHNEESLAREEDIRVWQMVIISKRVLGGSDSFLGKSLFVGIGVLCLYLLCSLYCSMTCHAWK